MMDKQKLKHKLLEEKYRNKNRFERYRKKQKRIKTFKY